MAGELANLGASQPAANPLAGLNPLELLECGLSAGGWTPPHPHELEKALPGYQVLRFIGRGGMGAVYQARQIELDRTVAIKIRPIEAGMAPDALDRFKREARALARLDHPKILRIYQSGITDDGDFFMAMEFLEGEDLGQRMLRGIVPVSEAATILRSVCEALTYAHEHGVIHRDIKPSNILLGRSGELKLADFGLAVFTSDLPDERVTRVTSRLGTVEYAAPEQLAGHRDATPMLDIYSLGVVAYELFTGQIPRGAFRKPSEIGPIDPAFDAPVMRALQGEPAQRWPSPAAFAAAIDAAHETALLAGTVEALGGKQANLLEQFYQRSTADLSPSISHAVEELLLTNSGYRDSRAFEDFLKAPAVTRSEVDKLISRRVLKVEQRGGAEWIELAHERLTGAVHARREQRRRIEHREAMLRAETNARLALRRRGGLALVAGAIALVMLLLGLFAWLKKTDAERQESRALLARTEAEKLISYLVEDLQGRLDEVGRLDLMKTSLNRVEEYYNSIAHHGEDELSLENRASFYQTRGHHNRLKGNLLQAENDLRRTIQLTELYLSKNPADEERAIKHSGALNTLGRFYSLRQDFTNSLAHYHQSLALTAPRLEAGSSKLKHAHARTLRFIGEAHGNLGALEQSGTNLQAAMTWLESITVTPDAEQAWKNDLALTFAELGTWHERKGDLPGALHYFTKYYEASKAIPSAEYWHNLKQGRIVGSAGRVGAILRQLGRDDEALEKYFEAAAILDKQKELMPRSTYIWHEARFIHGNIMRIYEARGQPDKAAAPRALYLEADQKLKEIGLK